jgi:hypothetical protein
MGVALHDGGADVGAGLRAAVARAQAVVVGGGRAVVVVCGTAFIMSAVRQELGVIEPRDDHVLLNKALRPGDAATDAVTNTATTDTKTDAPLSRTPT